MVRRKFIQQVSCGLAAVSPAAARTRRTVTYRITGFTCITCAIGLDTMLSDQKGIVRSKSIFAERTAVIEFDPDLVTEAKIRAFIEGIGFTTQNLQ